MNEFKFWVLGISFGFFIGTLAGTFKHSGDIRELQAHSEALKSKLEITERQRDALGEIYLERNDCVFSYEGVEL